MPNPVAVAIVLDAAVHEQLERDAVVPGTDVF